MNRNKELWQVVVWISCYFIWKNRNEMVFSTKKVGANAIFLEVQNKAFEWASRRSKKGEINWDNWLSDPCYCRFIKHTV